MLLLLFLEKSLLLGLSDDFSLLSVELVKSGIISSDGNLLSWLLSSAGGIMVSGVLVSTNRLLWGTVLVLLLSGRSWLFDEIGCSFVPFFFPLHPSLSLLSLILLSLSLLSLILLSLSLLSLSLLSLQLPPLLLPQLQLFCLLPFHLLIPRGEPLI